jgi:hypothetical protein
MKKQLILASIALIGGISFTSSPISQAASEFLPHHNQTLGRNCEAGYIGKGVFSSKGELLLCTKKSDSQRGWVLGPSKFVAGAATKCATPNQKKIILKVENTCIKFSDGNKFVKSSIITNANSGSNSPAPTQSSPTSTTSAAPTPQASASPSASTSIAPTPSVSPTTAKAGSGTGGGAGNGTGGGGGKGASPTPSTTP